LQGFKVLDDSAGRLQSLLINQCSSHLSNSLFSAKIKFSILENLNSSIMFYKMSLQNLGQRKQGPYSKHSIFFLTYG
jgi:hypothetical protein